MLELTPRTVIDTDADADGDTGGALSLLLRVNLTGGVMAVALSDAMWFSMRESPVLLVWSAVNKGRRRGFAVDD